MLPYWNVREINNHVGTFSEPHEQLIAQGSDIDRRSQEATFITNLPDFHAGDLAEVQDQEARLAAVQEAEAVAALLHYLVRPGVAVHHDHIAEELRVPDRRDVGGRNIWSIDRGIAEEAPRSRIEKRAVAIERAILNRDWNLVVLFVRREFVVLLGRWSRQHGWRSVAAIHHDVARAAAND